MIIEQLYKSEQERLTESYVYKNPLFEQWNNVGRVIVEQQLTVDQINQIFQQVEQGATAAGGNRTMLGKGVDAASAVNQAWEDLKTKVQNSGPIKNVDGMYDVAAEKLKQATGGDQGVMQYVQKYRDFAKAHPIAQSLIYSALIAAAGISGAGAGGAAALGLFKMVDKLLQGEKFSSAAYSGAKTGGMAYAAGQLGQAMKGSDVPTGPGMDQKFTDVNTTMDNGMQLPNDIVDSTVARQMDVLNDLGLPKDATYGQVVQAMKAQGYPDDWISGTMQDAARHATKAASAAGQGDAVQQWNNAASKADSSAFAASGSPTNPDGSASDAFKRFTDADAAQQSLYNKLPGQADTSSIPDAPIRPRLPPGASLSDFSNTASATPQGAGMSADYLNKVISGDLSRPMISPEQAQAALDWQAQNGGQLASTAANAASSAAKGYSQEYLQKVINGEIPRPMVSIDKAKELLGQMNESKKLSESQIYLVIGNIIERQRKLDEGIMDTVKGAASNAMNWAKTKTGNLTTKITADKLLQAWKKAGSPTDSLDIASVVQRAGVPADTIKQVFTSMRIPVPGTPGGGASGQRHIDVDPSSRAPGAGATAAVPKAPAAAAPAAAPSTAGVPVYGKTVQQRANDLAALRASNAPPAAADTSTVAEPTPTPTTAATPASIRQQKQAAASAAAQNQMAGGATPKAPAAPTAAQAKPMAPGAFNAANVMKLPGMEKYATPKPTPSFAGPSGYGKTTTAFKPAAPKTPAAPAAPKAPAAPGQLSKDEYIKRIGAPALPESRIAQVLKKPVAEMLQMVETKEDVQKIKRFVDQTFIKYGAVNESAIVLRNQIVEHVTQVGAQRRREFARKS